MVFRILFLIVCLVMACPCAHAQVSPTPLQRDGFKKATSHDQLLSYLHEVTKGNPRFVLETIGTSVQGRSIPMIRVIPAASQEAIRVLLFCQQHGNEPSGKEAALMLVERIARGDADALLSHIDLTIIPSVNPDGNESAKRANANGEDLNRNHLLLTQPEVMAVHSVFNRLQPEVTLDVHEYSAYRKEFRDVGYVRAVDEQFGAPTNLNIPATIREYALRTLFPFLEDRLKSRGVTFANYLKMNGPLDTVRTSTTSIDDGRQSFAILNRFSFILEGKNGRSMHDDLQRRATAQLVAIESFLEFVNNHFREIKTMVEKESKNLVETTDPVIVTMDYLYKGERAKLPVLSLTSGKDSLATFFIAPVVTPLKSVPRPKAYVVTQDQQDILALLQRHSLRFELVQEQRRQLVERYTIGDAREIWMENKSFWQLSTSVEQTEITLKSGDVIIPVNQMHGTMVAIALEPASMWGLVQYDEFSKLRTKGSQYPVFRISAEERKNR